MEMDLLSTEEAPICMACKAELYRKALLHLKKKEKKKTQETTNCLFAFTRTV